MKVKTLLVGVILIIIVQSGNVALCAAKAPGSQIEKVLGAWEIVESWRDTRSGIKSAQNVQPSIVLFTDNYYSFTCVMGNESRPLMPEDATRDDLTAEQAHSVWREYTSNSGKCKILPGKIITYPIVALWPNFMEKGTERIYHYKFDGDLLSLTVEEEDFSWKMKLKRLP